MKHFMNDHGVNQPHFLDSCIKSFDRVMLQNDWNYNGILLESLHAVNRSYMTT